MDQITAAQVAEQQGISVRTVHRMARAGHLPHTKLPTSKGAYLFDPADVERAFAAREAATSHAGP